MSRLKPAFSWSGALTALLPVAGALGGVTAETGSKPAPRVSCPESLSDLSSDRLTRWRDGLTKERFFPETLWKEIQACEKQVSAILSDPLFLLQGAWVSSEGAKFQEAFRQCVQNLRSLGRDETAYSPNDGTYVTAARAAMPGLVDVPGVFRGREFNEQLSGIEGALDLPQEKRGPEIENRVERIRRTLRKGNPGAEVFVYKSGKVPAPDGSDARSRLFVFLPGPKFDQFFQIALPDNKGGTLPVTTSVVAVQKQDRSGKALSPPHTYFVDYYRERGGGHGYTTRIAKTGSAENCTSCHVSGPLAIHSGGSYMGASVDWKAVSVVNAAIGSYGMTRSPILGDMRPSRPDYGPDIDRDPAFIESCAPKLSPKSREKVRSAMSCALCHDGRARANPIHMSLRDDYVRGGIMPPGAKLEESERNALASCLDTEYSTGWTRPDGTRVEGILDQWAKNRACPSLKPELPPRAASSAKEAPPKGAGAPAAPAGKPGAPPVLKGL